MFINLPFIFAEPGNTEENIKELKARVLTLEDEIKKLNTENEKLKEQLKTKDKEINELTENMSKMQRHMDKMSKEREKDDKRLADLEKSRQSAQHNKNTRIATIVSKLIAQIYKFVHQEVHVDWYYEGFVYGIDDIDRHFDNYGKDDQRKGTAKKRFGVQI